MLEKTPLIQPFAHDSKRRKRIFYLIILFLLLVLSFGAFRLAKFYQNNFSGSEFKEGITALETIKNTKEAISAAPLLLGYERPQTYLILFLNNTEIRPGGGFIGSYALIRADKGKIDILETNGSENLDWSAPADFKIKAPSPISIYMKQPLWFFRDSNWSPDFSVSARTAMWFYRFEGGREGSKIDGVIGITPTVVEKLMEITGPLKVGGKEFGPANFTEELEYHVEYGFRETGQPVAERKAIIGDLSRALLHRVTSLPPWRWGEVWGTFLNLLKEKQIMIFSNNADLQNILARNDWAGLIKETTSDYLLVVDSNLASLKTDPSVKRKITYKIRPSGDDYLAQVVVEYDHQGSFDWRTTRYRTYTKIYAPLGSKLVGAEGFIDEKKNSASPDLGSELNKSFFGGFLSIEPQTKKTILVEYTLPANIKEQIKNGLYTLFVQKQLGTLSHTLTVDLDFGKTNGAHKIFQNTDLRTDREFQLN